MRDGLLVLTIVLALVCFRGLVTVLGAGAPTTSWITTSVTDGYYADASYGYTYTPGNSVMTGNDGPSYSGGNGYGWSSGGGSSQGSTAVVGFISKAVGLPAQRTDELLEELDKLDDDELNLIAKTPDEACSHVSCEGTTGDKVANLADVTLENHSRRQSLAAVREMGGYNFWLVIAGLLSNAIAVATIVAAYHMARKARANAPVAAAPRVPDIHMDARPGP